MQIQNSCACRPNFGMAMRITPKAGEALKEASLKTLEELSEIGKDLKNTKHYHLEIGENLTPKIDSIYANAYLPPFHITKPNGRFLTVRGIWDGTRGFIPRNSDGRVHFFVKFDNKEQAVSVYDNLNAFTMNERKRAAALVKLLDEQMEKKVIAEAAEKAQKEEVALYSADLMKEFGGEAHVRP